MTKLYYVPKAFFKVFHFIVMNLHKFYKEEEKLGDHADWINNQEECLVIDEDWKNEGRIKEKQIDVKHSLIINFLITYNINNSWSPLNRPFIGAMSIASFNDHRLSIKVFIFQTPIVEIDKLLLHDLIRVLFLLECLIGA